MRQAIFVSFLGKEERADAGMKALERSKGFIRRELARRMTIRKVPELKFKIDHSLDRGNHIEAIIRDMHKGE